MDAKSFGARLRELRQHAGLTQKELAARAGVRHASIATWEQGTREPLVSNVATLAEALGVNVAKLFEPPKSGEAKRGRHPGRKGK